MSSDQTVNLNREILLRSAAWLGLGLAIGIGFGLFLGWVAWPLEVSEATPAVMEEAFQEDYTLMIAAAYYADDELAIARRRLSGLDKEDIARWVLGLAVDHILNDQDPDEILSLVKLTTDLGQYSPILEPYLSQNGPDG